MSVKPVSVSTILTPVLREPGNKPPDYNRFAALADRSRSPSTGRLPPPSPATKRPSDEPPTQQGKSIRLDPSKVFYVMENVEKMMAKGRDDFGKVAKLLSEDKTISPAGKEMIGGLASGMEHMMDALEAMASIVVDSATKQTIVYNDNMVRGVGEKNRNKAPELSQEEIKKKKFVNTVRDADKSLLVFGLDLGKVPIMNTSTLARNVTQDIVRKAAAVEGNGNGRPKEETVVTLDDTMSMVSGMDFFGKASKPYENRKNATDPANGTFCTMPVKLSFKSKEAKARAEKVLKKTCKVQCTTPYPLGLRQVINKVLHEQKNQFPGCFIQVKPDPDNLTLSVSRRADSGWINNYQSINLDNKVMDLEGVRNTQSQSTDVVMIEGSSQASL
jgi:hypothetical protein